MDVLPIPRWVENAALARAPERLLEKHLASIAENLTALTYSGRLCPACRRLLAWPPRCPSHGPPLAVLGHR